MSPCTLCPHLCGARRAAGETGRCRSTEALRIARAAPHHFEEPPISGTKGSGTVFFVGCSLSCCFCQNKSISRGNAGHTVSEAELADTLLALADTGVHNLNLVTGTHFTPQIARVLEKIKPRLQIPVVWNSSGYERVEALRLLDGLVDIYLPDFKYSDNTLAITYSGAPNYAAHATASIREMHRQTGAVCFDENGLLKKGTVIRHLVLPGCRLDSLAVLEKIAKTVPVSEVRLSLLRQYTPDFAPEGAPKNLHRRVTSFEYDSVVQRATELGFLGYTQEKESASAAFTPDFEV